MKIMIIQQDIYQHFAGMEGKSNNEEILPAFSVIVLAFAFEWILPLILDFVTILWEISLVSWIFFRSSFERKFVFLIEFKFLD